MTETKYEGILKYLDQSRYQSLKAVVVFNCVLAALFASQRFVLQKDY